MKLKIYTDGACLGNPGEAAIGYIIYEEDKVVKECSKALGVATNNIAEYTALIYALQEALKLRAQSVNVFTDSELMHRQIIGAYKVKDEKLKGLYEQAKHLIDGFDQFTIEHVRRELNKEADRLASSALTKQADTVAPAFNRGGEESPSSEG